MKTNEFLVSLGLTKAEAKIYLELLKGQSSIRTLAGKTAINRGQVYESLKNLSAKGLVSFITKGQRRHFVAENPDKLEELVQEREEHTRRLKTQTEALLPALKAIGQRQHGEPLVRFYEDNEGITSILRDVLATTSQQKNKQYYLYSSLPLRRFIYRSFPKFTPQRIKAGILVKVIAVGKGGDPAELSMRKWLPGPTGTEPSSYTIIYGDKIALISVSADKTPYGVIMEEPGVATMQKYLFEQLWEKI